ncbi:hypothetical protein MMC13_003267 [Lambiella insularis]|nr:hypothetical protein [Lambiella insularis]
MTSAYKRAFNHESEIDPLSPLTKRRKISHGNGYPKTAHSHPVLTLYYAKVYSLRSYLLSKLPVSSKSRRRKISSLGLGRRLSDKVSVEHGNFDRSLDVRLAELLDSTIVGKGPDEERDATRTKDFELFSQQTTSSITSSIEDGTVSQPEIVDFAVWLLFNKIHRQILKPPHILCHGYQRASAPRIVCEDCSAVGGIPGLMSLYPNPYVATIKGPVWGHLLKVLGKVGDRVMLDLILDCGLFSALDTGKDNYYQLSGWPGPVTRNVPADRLIGVPLPDMPSLDSSEKLPPCPPYARNLTLEKTLPFKHEDAARSRIQISFVRSRMMHARCALNAKGEVQFGLRHIHVFNRYTEHDNLQHTIHIMKYIFPRQFSLHNVFTSSVNSRESSHIFKDYTLREQEIAIDIRRLQAKHRKTLGTATSSIPKRLRGSPVDLVAKLQKLHCSCSYSALLKHYCPVEYIDRRARRKNTKRSSRRPGPQARPYPGSMAVSDSLSKTTLTDTATPPEWVSAFCRAVLLRIMPKAFWGEGQNGVENQASVLQSVNCFIFLRRFENLNLHAVSQKLKIRSMAWLAPPKVNISSKLSRSDAGKRLELLLELLYYVFDSILIPLIRSNFHVTESSAHGSRLFFFRHDLWRACTEPTLSTMKLTMLREIPVLTAKKLLDARILGFSQIRLLPKARGLRPIMNLRRRITKLHNGKAVLGRSINSVMAPVYNMLSYEKSKRPDSLGAALFSIGDLYPKIKDFRARLRGNNRGDEVLYFAKVDVQSCFDTIPQHQVVKLVEQLCLESDYRIARHAEIKSNDIHGYDGCARVGSKPARKFVASATAGHDFKTFEEFLQDMPAQGKKRTIFVDSVVQTAQDKDQLMDLLQEHVEKNVIKIGKKFFRQKHGIPQGSVLSSLLCSFFYADFERKCLGSMNKSESLLFRLIDDFLLITTDLPQAKEFLQIMHDGNTEYGISVRKDKSMASFEFMVDGVLLPRVTEATFPYCGIMIDRKTLEITKDRERRTNTVLADSLTVETSKVPGKNFHRKAMNALKIQMHAMFMDTSLNSPDTVLLTIYQNMEEAAMKVYRYAKAMGGEGLPSSLLIRTITDLGELAFVLIQSQHESQRSRGYECSVRRSQIEW